MVSRSPGVFKCVNSFCYRSTIGYGRIRDVLIVDGKDLVSATDVATATLPWDIGLESLL